MKLRADYLLLRLVSGARHRLVRRATPAGLAVLVALLICAGIGIDTTVTLTYQIFCLLVALVIVCLVSIAFHRGRFEGRRTLPEFATVGEPVSYRVEIANRGRRVERGLTLVEFLADPRPGWARFSAASGRAFQRWQRLLAREASVRIPDRALPPMAPGETTRVRHEFVPARRGAIRFRALGVARADPVGLFFGFRTVPAPQTLLVLPKRYRVPEIAFPGTRRYQHGGVTQATSVGDSEEFQGLREYREGDPLQRIHWKSFARTGKPVVREYQDEFFERHALVLDTFTDDDVVLEEAVSVAASLACTVETRDSLLDLLFVDGESYRYTLGRGQDPIETLMEVLAHVNAGEHRDFLRLHETVLGHRPELSSCLLLLVAWDDARRALVDALRETGLDVLVLLIAAEDNAPPEPERPADLRVLRPGFIEADLAGL